MFLSLKRERRIKSRRKMKSSTEQKDKIPLKKTIQLQGMYDPQMCGRQVIYHYLYDSFYIQNLNLKKNTLTIHANLNQSLRWNLKNKQTWDYNWGWERGEGEWDQPIQVQPSCNRQNLPSFLHSFHVVVFFFFFCSLINNSSEIVPESPFVLSSQFQLSTHHSRIIILTFFIFFTADSFKYPFAIFSVPRFQWLHVSLPSFLFFVIPSLLMSKFRTSLLDYYNCYFYLKKKGFF